MKSAVGPHGPLRPASQAGHSWPRVHTSPLAVPSSRPRAWTKVRSECPPTNVEIEMFPSTLRRTLQTADEDPVGCLPSHAGAAFRGIHKVPGVMEHGDSPGIRNETLTLRLTAFIQHRIGNPSTGNWQEKDIKSTQIRKGKVKLPLFAEDMLLSAESPKDSARKLFEVRSEFSEVARCRIDVRK